MSKMKRLQDGWDGLGYILVNHMPGIASNMMKIIGASCAYNIAWQAWNTGQSVLRENTGMMEMMTWKGEMLTGWTMRYDM